MLQTTSFIPSQILSWAYDYNMDELLNNSGQIIRDAVDAADVKWERHIPSWPDRGHKRGRLPWGAWRDKEGNVHYKSWAEPKLCRMGVLRGLNFYMDNTGVPPSKAGESLIKAIKEGRRDIASLKDSPTRGLTRGQIRLVPCLPPDDIDLRSVFVVVFAAEYCRTIKVSTIYPHYMSTLYVHTLYRAPRRWRTVHRQVRRSYCLSVSPVCWANS